MLAFALMGGGLVFALALTAPYVADRVAIFPHLGMALGLGLVCAALIRLAAGWSLAPQAEAIRVMHERLEQAAAGDIASPPPAAVDMVWPGMGEAMAAMFARMRRNLRG